MFVKVTINTDTEEGENIVRILQNYPESVTFLSESTHKLNEPEPAYKAMSKKKQKKVQKNYKTLEEFRKEMHDFVAGQYAK